MKKRYLILAFLFVLIASMHFSSFANEADDAKAALTKSIGSLSGEGAKIAGPMTTKEIEKESMKEISKCKRCPQVPFGFQNDKWEKFKSKYKSGDAIFYFHSDKNSWQGLYGREGYALIRGKEVIDVILTAMS